MDEVILLGIESGATILTANSRMAARLSIDWGQYQNNILKRNAWPTPNIYSLSEWINQIWQAIELVENNCPLLLNSSQELSLWSKIIENNTTVPLFQVNASAKLAMRAWRTLIAWRQSPVQEVETYTSIDVITFQKWAAIFKEKLILNKWITQAEIIPWILEHCRDMKPQNVLLVGFDELTPELEHFFSTLKSFDWQISEYFLSIHSEDRMKLGFNTTEEEIIAAACWAKNLLENGEKGPIAIVLPELAKMRSQVEDLFKEIFHPLAIFKAYDTVSPIFSLSAGTPLGTVPIIEGIFHLLSCLKSNIEINNLRKLLYSPFYMGGETDLLERGQFISELQKTSRFHFAMDEIVKFLKGTENSTKKIFEVILAYQQEVSTVAKPSQWAEWIQSILLKVDWPGERVLTSIEHQAVKAWYNVLNEFASLDMIHESLTFSEAVKECQIIANYTPFQPESGQVPISILGVLEAAGQTFSHLWIAGLNNKDWPPQPDPNPFIDKELQRRLNMPHATGNRELEFCKRITLRFLESAQNVVVSYAAQDELGGMAPSELIYSIPFGEREAFEIPYPYCEKAIAESAKLETFEDRKAPQVTQLERVKGGTNIIKLQAACPFKAFAEIRLNAKEVEEEPKGLTNAHRGILVHEILNIIWLELKSQSILIEMSDEKLQNLIDSSILQCIYEFKKKNKVDLPKRFWDVEKERLHVILFSWLQLEKERKPFRVDSLERWQNVKINDLLLKVRIDRVDRLQDGSIVVIDYKTGDISLADCFGERLNEPQLPLYCFVEGGKDKVKGVVLGIVNVKGCKFIGITEEEDLFPKVKTADAQQRLFIDLNILGAIDERDPLLSWDKLTNYWGSILNQLANDFIGGKAEVMPKDLSITCQYCSLPGLCRIREKIL